MRPVDGGHLPPGMPETSALDPEEEWAAGRLRSALGHRPLEDLNRNILAQAFATEATAQVPAPQVRRRKWRWMILGVGATALAAVVLLRLGLRSEMPGPFASVEIDRGGSIQVSRGDVRPGDQVVVRFSGPEAAKHVQLRLYRDDATLVFECDDEPPCHFDVTSGRVVARFPLAERATYRVVVLASSSSLPPASGSYDRDTAAAQEQGAQRLLSQIIKIH